MKQVILITDGACKGNPGPGGWAALLRCGSVEKVLCGSDSMTTNNRMELQAVIEGVRALKESVNLTIQTDSQYIVRAFKDGWLRKWQSNGWKSGSGPVKNVDQWQELVALLSEHTVTWEWVRGHNGHPDNERVDALAQAEALRSKVQAC